MPTKKVSAKLTSVKQKNWKEKIKTVLLTPKNLIIIGLIILAVLFWWGRKYFIVAMVNGQPISRFELSSRLKSQFGETVLDQLINERLLLGATRQQGIFITAEEIDQRIKEIEKSLEGKMSLEQALGLQGLTLSNFRRQLELQLSIEKKFAKEATVSGAEIDEYLKNSENQFPDATDPAKLKTEVESFIKQQKISKLYEEWFGKIKQEAKISRNI